MAPVSGDVVEKEKKPKKRFSLKSPKKKKEEPVLVPATTPELVIPSITPVSPGSIDDSNSMSAISISDVSASDPNSSPKKGSRLNMSFRKKKKDLDSNGNEVLRVSTQDLAVARDRAAELERELEHSSADLDISKNKITELEKRVSELESVQQDNLEKLDDRKSEIDSLKREINRLKTIEEQHERMKAEQAKASEATAKSTEIAGLQATILNKSSEIETLKARVVDYEASSEISKKCLKTLQDQIETMEVEMRTQAELKESETLTHQSNIKALEAQVEQGKGESERLESNFNAQLNAEVQRMAEVQQLVQQELDEKMAELNTLRAQVEQGDPELVLLKASNEELKQALATTETELASLSSKLSSTEAELAASTATCREGEVQIVELQLKIEDLAAVSAEMDAAALEEINQLNTLLAQNKDILLLKDASLALAEELKDKSETLLATALAEQKELSATEQALTEEIAQGAQERVMLEEKIAEYELESKKRGEDSNLELLNAQNDIKAQLVKIEDLKTNLINKTEEHEQVTENFNNQAQQLEALRKDVSQQLDQIENLENSAQDAIEKAEESNQKLLLSEAEMSNLSDELEQQKVTLQSQLAKIESLTEDLAHLTTDKDNIIAQLTVEKLEAASKLETEESDAIARLEAEKSEAIAYLEAEKADTITELEAEKSDAIAKLEAEKADAIAELEAEKSDAIAKLEAEKADAIADLEAEKSDAIAKLEAEKSDAIAELQSQLCVDNCINYDMIERGDVEGLGDLIVVQKETVQSLGHSLAEVTQKRAEVSEKSNKVEQLEKELSKLTAELEASVASVKMLEASVKVADTLQDKYNTLSKERDELDSQFSVMEEALAVEEKHNELKDSLLEKSEREIKDQKRKIEKLSKNLANSQTDIVKQEDHLTSYYTSQITALKQSMALLVESKESSMSDVVLSLLSIEGLNDNDSTNKTGQKEKQVEKEVIELKGQLNKVTKEAEKNLRENKKTQGQLLDTKANLADLQLKLSKLSEEKRLLEKVMPAAPITLAPVANDTECKDKELISKLEKQLSSLKSEKDQVHSEINSALWQKQMAVAGGLAGAGVASAVAYLTALYSC